MDNSRSSWENKSDRERRNKITSLSYYMTDLFSGNVNCFLDTFAGIGQFYYLHLLRLLHECFSTLKFVYVRYSCMYFFWLPHTSLHIHVHVWSTDLKLSGSFAILNVLSLSVCNKNIYWVSRYTYMYMYRYTPLYLICHMAMLFLCLHNVCGSNLNFWIVCYYITAFLYR